MKLLFSNLPISLVILIGVFIFFSCEKKAEESQPNIILFLVDDMGWQDTSVPFWDSITPYNQRYNTPNMERLASQGMKFTQAYATPVCSPTRVSLMTGMNAARHRVTNWTLYADQTRESELNQETLEFPMWNVNGLSMDTTRLAVRATPLPAILREAGYKTIHVGKAHFGAVGTPGEDPLNLGFDINIAGHAAGAPRSYWGEDGYGNNPRLAPSPWTVPGLEKYHDSSVNLTEALTREAIAASQTAIDEGEPFYLYMAHYGVHTPIMEDHRFYQKYLDMGIDTIEARYASMVESMDKSLGDLMDHIEKNNIEKETIILFMSDNGGLSANSRGGELHLHNQPLRSGKGSMYEGGIRVPMIAKWPSVVAPASSQNTPLIIEDFFPSILAMAGVEDYKTIQTVDGESFLPLLVDEDEKVSTRSFVWHYPNKWGSVGPGIGPTSTIRKGDWKLIYYHIDEHMELYNIPQDISESYNLINENSEIALQLANTLSEYLRKIDAQMPVHKETGERVPFPNAG